MTVEALSMLIFLRRSLLPNTLSVSPTRRRSPLYVISHHSRSIINAYISTAVAPTKYIKRLAYSPSKPPLCYKSSQSKHYQCFSPSLPKWQSTLLLPQTAPSLCGRGLWKRLCLRDRFLLPLPILGNLAVINGNSFYLTIYGLPYTASVVTLGCHTVFCLVV